MISYHLITNQGSRSCNEDSVGVAKVGENHCFVLADGLGGHGRGEVASNLAIRTILEHFAKDPLASEEALSESMEEAQASILRMQREDRKYYDMKTTCVMLQISEKQLLWAYVGDSRLYYFQKHRLEQRTLDHSVPQMLVASGQLKESQIRYHPDRNRLLRVMGHEWDAPKYEISKVFPSSPGSRFLLCSDGFWEYIDEKQMQNEMKKSKNPEQWISRMTEEVRKNGRNKNMDNYSAIAVWIN